MKAIIIEEERFAELAQLLRGVADRVVSYPQVTKHMEDSGVTEKQIKFLAEDIFRAYHLEFVRWAQSHGASCVR